MSCSLKKATRVNKEVSNHADQWSVITKHLVFIKINY